VPAPGSSLQQSRGDLAQGSLLSPPDPGEGARWFGFDRNPLRRGTDPIEGALRLVMIIVVVAVVPATAVAAGRWTYHYVVHQAQAQQAADHQVSAVLLRDAPATGTPDPYTSVQTAWVPARW
jgi:hypothetical protein